MQVSPTLEYVASVTNSEREVKGFSDKLSRRGEERKHHVGKKKKTVFWSQVLLKEKPVSN